jgi:dihydrodipicolinate synthase/N-acetylneuraminate lyase
MRDIMYLASSTQLAVYAMLEIRNVISAHPRSPFMPASEEEKDKIRDALIQLGVL